MSNLELPNRSLPGLLIEASICVALNITSIIRNSLVCMAAYRNPNMRSTTNLYIIALAVSDLLCATIEMPLASTTLIIGRWDFGDAVCQMQGFIDVFSTYATPATLGLTAIKARITFNRPDFITSSTDNYSSLDSEDDYRTDSRNVTNNSSFQNYTHPDDHTTRIKGWLSGKTPKKFQMKY